jgi:PBP1b-binding outer membrane lipoprotein LpoB
MKETQMKSLALVLAALTLSGCVVAPYDNYRPPPPRGGAYMDRDRDGVPNRYDRRPDNPYRY